MQFSQNFCNLQSLSKKDIKDKMIGILGGSFNPPHDGHVAISTAALDLGMDMILWLPTPQNPYKPPYQYSIDERIDMCCNITKEIPNIFVSDIEKEIDSKNTYGTLSFMTSKYSDTKFTWVMGIDCLKNFHLWENYDKIGELVNFIIFNRNGFENQLESSIAGKMILNNFQNKLTFIPDILSNKSSTEIRDKLNDTYTTK